MEPIQAASASAPYDTYRREGISTGHALGMILLRRGAVAPLDEFVAQASEAERACRNVARHTDAQFQTFLARVAREPAPAAALGAFDAGIRYGLAVAWGASHLTEAMRGVVQPAAQLNHAARRALRRRAH